MSDPGFFDRWGEAVVAPRRGLARADAAALGGRPGIDLALAVLVAVADGSTIFVNTQFNCLAIPDPRHSFKMIWKPPFIKDIVKEDRCHLNGLAMKDGTPAYVTAVSRSDTIDGWRFHTGRSALASPM